MLNNLKAIEIKNLENLKKLIVNEKVSVEGLVVEERFIYENTILVKLDNEVEIICECDSFLNKNIRVEGVIEEFENKKQVRALKVEVLN